MSLVAATQMNARAQTLSLGFRNAAQAEKVRGVHLMIENQMIYLGVDHTIRKMKVEGFPPHLDVEVLREPLVAAGLNVINLTAAQYNWPTKEQRRLYPSRGYPADMEIKRCETFRVHIDIIIIYPFALFFNFVC